MGNIITRTVCPIYPLPDSDSDNDNDPIYDETTPIKPSEVMEREYITKEKMGIKQDVLLRPSQIINIENKKLHKLSNR
jgi:hypothetical protein